MLKENTEAHPFTLRTDEQIRSPRCHRRLGKPQCKGMLSMEGSTRISANGGGGESMQMRPFQ